MKWRSDEKLNELRLRGLSEAPRFTKQTTYTTGGGGGGMGAA